ncbi:MAG TPA: dihydropteroate synthase [Steroidobacteraceae bacterium]|jgi:dihydropteroate synthase|nr:dihydropteroate synthase [Steroidobacteraceae bacterium]
MQLQCGPFPLDLDRPVVMGVLNVTPDSFSDGGRFADADAAVAAAERMAADGAALVDVGGESTRPGSVPVDEAEELRRVMPVIERLAGRLPIPVSIDTRKPGVMRRAVEAGASLVNDVGALRAPGAIEAVAGSGAAVCLMHMQGEPGTMQDAPRYADVVTEVREFLRRRVAACEAAGIGRARIAVDPGFGFGKSLEHNLALLAGLPVIAADGLPLLVGLSRKRMIGTLTGRGDGERLAGSLAAAVVAAQNGARIVRAHDVRETVDALRVVAAAGAMRDNRA